MDAMPSFDLALTQFPKKLVPAILAAEPQPYTMLKLFMTHAAILAMKTMLTAKRE